MAHIYAETALTNLSSVVLYNIIITPLGNLLLGTSEVYGSVFVCLCVCV